MGRISIQITKAKEWLWPNNLNLGLCSLPDSVELKAKAAQPAVSDEAAIGDDPESHGDPYIGSAK
jgi:hypothetical protein